MSSSLENLGGIPTVEDIDEWHDTGEVGSLYMWCQQMAEELRQAATKEIFVVYLTGEHYDGDENLRGNSFCLIGVFSDPQKAKDAASRHEATIETRTLNEINPEWYL